MALSGAIARNVLAGADPETAKPLARYAFEVAARLAAQPFERLLAGEIEFPAPQKATANAG